MPPARDLPAKEAALFKKALKCYEQKQYKQGLKACNTILAKPALKEHGETLAMKGLTLNCMNKKAEGYDYVKRGLRNDLTSHVCWHVHGLMHRSDQNYNQSIRCYKQALKFSPDNMQILRDLSLMQVQMRDLEGFKETRNILLKHKPAQEVSWIGFAVAHHLNQEHAQAVNVLDAYENAQDKNSEGDRRYELGQLAQYRLLVLREAGDASAALAYLTGNRKQFMDDRYCTEKEVELLLALGRGEEAAPLLEGLIDTNPDRTEYFRQLFRAKGLDSTAPKDAAAVLTLLDEKRAGFPKAQVPVMLALEVATGDDFRQRMGEFLTKGLRKGVPVFGCVRPLFADAAKANTTLELVKGYLECMLAEGKFVPDQENKESPSVLIWLRWFLTQHYDYLGEHEKALELVGSAIDHTPTVLELYMAKAKVLKHVGDLAEAAKVLDYARSLDTADRYINSKAVKYMLRAGEVDRAEELAGLFTREAGQSPMEQLTDMQCLWFMTEEAAALLKKRHTGKALTKLHDVEKAFAQITDDQLDFHSYCARKMTLTSYIRLLRFEDNLRGQKFFVRAALMAARAYVGLHDAPFGSAASDAQDPLMAGMTPGERKKFLNKQRKAAAKAAAAAEPSKGDAAKKGADGKVAEPVDVDKLAKTTTPLDDVKVFLEPLLRLAPGLIDTHTAAFEVYRRRNRPLLCLRAANHAADIDANDPRTRMMVLQLAHMAANVTGLPAPVAQVLAEGVQTLTGGKSAKDLLATMVSEAKDGRMPLAVAAAHGMVSMDATTATDAIQVMAAAAAPGITVKDALAARDAARQLAAGNDAVEGLQAFQARLQELLPLATALA